MEILPLKFIMLLFLTEPTTESKETSRITRDPFHIGTKYCQKQVNIQHSRLLKASKKSGLLFHKFFFFCVFFLYCNCLYNNFSFFISCLEKEKVLIGKVAYRWADYRL